MLYKKNQAKTLDDALFRAPTSEYRATPFWAWNCALDKDDLLRQIDVFQQMGFGGAHMHVRSGLATPYLSDEFMDLIRACTDHFEENGMLAWLYDEDRWPSGAAGGIVTKDERWRARHLVFTPERKAQVLAGYEIEQDGEGYLTGYTRLPADAAEAEGRWFACLEVSKIDTWYNNQTYLDTLNPEAVQEFVRVTHERYKAVVGDRFGTTIPSIFTDEPQFTRKQQLGRSRAKAPILMPWTDSLPEFYKNAYNADVLDTLPDVFWERRDSGANLARYRFHDCVAEMFTRAFADTVGAWCDANGIALTGHMMEEPRLLSQTSALGEAMRSYRGFGIPGIDMLCDHREFTTAKQCQSAVHQYGREGMLSELDGVTGWDFDFRGHKLHGDWQACLGVTVRVPHLAWASMKGEGKRDYPASIHDHSPWWKEYHLIEDHFARVNTAMTRGKPIVRVAMIHPVESYWLAFGPKDKTAFMSETMDRDFERTCEGLLRAGIDFDYICESLLPELCPAGGNPLTVGEMAYDAVVVPNLTTIRRSTLARLEAFRDAGGTIIFSGHAPRFVDVRPCDDAEKLASRCVRTGTDLPSLVTALEPFREVDLRFWDGRLNDRLIYQLRQDTDCRWLFLAHADPIDNRDMARARDYELTLKGLWHAVLYDTMTGDIRPIPAVCRDGKTAISLRLYDCDSVLLKLLPGEGETVREEPQKALARVIAVPDRTAYTLDEPNALILDQARFALDGGDLRDRAEVLYLDNLLRRELGWPEHGGHAVQPWVIPAETPEHALTLEFTFRSEIRCGDVHLAMEDAGQAEIRLDGKRVPKHIDGWYADRSIETIPLGAIEAGEHTLLVTIPFGRRTDTERCYLLGDFGVRCEGAEAYIVAPNETLAFDDIAGQGLPFYGGNVTWAFDAALPGGEVELHVPHYRGAIVRVRVDGEDAGYVMLPPYRLRFTAPEGAHRIELTLGGHRFNGFGAVHDADLNDLWQGPGAWRTRGDAFTESYRLKPIGIMTKPRILA